MRYTRRPLITLAVALLVGGWSAAASGQPTEREIVVSVVDREGVPVLGLEPSDFIVREDGTRREVLSVRPDTDRKQIALLVDNSAASGRAVMDIRKAASAFVASMAGDHEIAIVSVGGTPRILAEPTDDTAQLEESIGRIFTSSDSASYLLDAVSDTAQGFIRRQAPRPVIVALSTRGVDYSNVSDQAALDRLADAGIPVHTVVLTQGAPANAGFGARRRDVRPAADPFGNLLREPGFAQTPLPDRSEERNRFLRTGPTATGGRHQELIMSASAEGAFQNLAAQLRNQYVVVYVRPAALIPPERIEIDVDRDGLDAKGAPLDRSELSQ